MRVILGIVAAMILAGSLLFCPAPLREQVSLAVTPSAELSAEVDATLEAFMDHVSRYAPDLGSAR